MKPSTQFHLIAGLAFLIYQAPNESQAAAGDLQAPGIAYPQSCDAAARKTVQAALALDGCDFLGGRWVNSSTSLRYAGDTEALSKFLQALARCPDATISLSFAKELFEGGDWLVQHQAHDHHFHIRINLNSDRIRLPKLDLPEIVAQPGSAAPGEFTAADRYTPHIFSFTR